MNIAKLLFFSRKMRLFSNTLLPALICILDEINLAKYTKIIPLLKNNGMVIIRVRNPKESLVRKIAVLCQRYRVKLLIAADPYLALKVKAAGLHISEKSFNRLKHWRNKQPQWIITAAAHTVGKIRLIKEMHLSAAIYSAVFPTTTHPVIPLGVMRFMHNLQKTDFTVYALGGINVVNIRRLQYAELGGVAAISAFDI